MTNMHLARNKLEQYLMHAYTTSPQLFKSTESRETNREV